MTEMSSVMTSSCDNIDPGEGTKSITWLVQSSSEVNVPIRLRKRRGAFCQADIMLALENTEKDDEGWLYECSLTPRTRQQPDGDCCAGLSRPDSQVHTAANIMPRYDKIETYSYTRWAYPSALDYQHMFRGSFREALGLSVQGHDVDEDPGWMTCSIWRDRHIHSYDVCVKKSIYVVTSDSLVDAASKEVVDFEPAMTIESVAVTAIEAAATDGTSAKSGQTKSSRTKSSRTQKSHNKSSRSKDIRSKDHNTKASRSKTSRPKPSIQTAKPETATSSLPAIPEEPVPLMPLWEMMAANYAAAGGDLSTLRYIGFRGLKDDSFRCSIWHEYEAQLGRGTAIGADKIQTMPGAEGWVRLLGVNLYLQAVEGLIAKVNDGLPVGRRRTITIITMLPARAWTPNGFYDMIVELGGEGEYEDFVLYRGRREDNDIEHDDDQVVYKGRPAK